MKSSSVWHWTLDLIWFDNGRSFKTRNYFVRQLFSLNKGPALLPLLKDGHPITGRDSCWASAVLDQTTNDLIIKILNVSKNQKDIRINLTNARFRGPATLQVLGGTSLTTTNSFYFIFHPYDLLIHPYLSIQVISPFF